jgi:predicted phosphodiesterase
VRVAALYDVHGNLPALEAVLAEAEAARADAIVLGGDLVAGAYPHETLARIRSLDAISIRGNSDELAEPWPEEWDAERRWLAGLLDEDERAWLDALPFSWSADETLYVHANPRDTWGRVDAQTPEAEAAALLEGVEARRVVSGHVHLQFEREVAGRRWVGAGSVGLPYEAEPGAYWALVEPGRVSFRRTEYDAAGVAEAIRASGHPLADRLLGG